MFTKPFQSLRRLSFLSLALPLAGFVLFAGYRYYQLLDVAELQVSRSQRVAHEHALKILDGADALQGRILDIVDRKDPAVLATTESLLHARLSAFAAGKPQIQSLWVIGSDGFPLATSRFFPAPKVSFSDRPYFDHHKNGRGGTYLSEPFKSRTTGDLVADISVAFKKPDGSFGGIVNVSLDTNYFKAFHRDLIGQDEGLALTLLRSSGVMFTRWPQAENPPDRLRSTSPVMTRIQRGEGLGEFNGLSPIDGQNRMVSFKKVGDYPLYVVAAMSLSAVRAQWIKELLAVLAIALPFVAGFFYTTRVAVRSARVALTTSNQLVEETLTRQRAEEALLQAQKLEALGRLTGGVAHDFNNALMVISNNLFLIKRHLPDRLQAQLASMGRAVDSATKLTRQLLAFSRRQPLLPELIRLQDKLPHVKELIAPVIGSKIAVSIDVAPDTKAILLDSAELELALLNLAINARDAMPEGGSLRITACNGPVALAGEPGDTVVIEAVDTGSGIEAAVLEKVFEPFFTTKPLGQGTGLGLSQVYGLCVRGGGRASISSKVGVGTTVSLRFPGVLASSANAQRSQQVTAPMLRKSVLVVEDNDQVAEALVAVLQELGCSVTRVSRAQAACEWLDEQPALPDVVLSDVVMPGAMDGLALAEHILARHPLLPIVLMTGYSEQLSTIERAGFEVIPKPCSAEVLATGITAAIHAVHPAKPPRPEVDSDLTQA